MSKLKSYAQLSAVDMSIAAGSLIGVDGGTAGQPMIALSAPDEDGYLRFAPMATTDGTGKGSGLAIEASDFIQGGLAGWLRLDRVGWRYSESAEILGVLKPAALARVHRALCTQEARSYADIAHRASAFVPGRTPVPPSGKVIGARELELLVESSLDETRLFFSDLLDHDRPARNIVAHSDVAPDRKEDPGEKFDWHGLAPASGSACAAPRKLTRASLIVASSR